MTHTHAYTYTHIHAITCVFQLVDISHEGFLNLMDESGEVREDIKNPESDIGKEIKTKFDAGNDILVTVISAMGEEAAIATKPMNK